MSNAQNIKKALDKVVKATEKVEKKKEGAK